MSCLLGWGCERCSRRSPAGFPVCEPPRPGAGVTPPRALLLLHGAARCRCVRFLTSRCAMASSGGGGVGVPRGTSDRCVQMDYEGKVFPLTGGYGRYNRIVVIFSWFPNFAVVLNLFSDVFFTLIPEDYHCKPDPQLLPSAFLLNLSDNAPRERVSCTRGWEYHQAAGLQSNFVTEWDLVCSEYWKIPLQHICFMMGWILGYILLGSLCDWFGRRKSFLLSLSVSSLLGVSVCLSNSAVAFLLLRLAQGCTLAGVYLSTYINRLELCDPAHRLMVAMVSGCGHAASHLLLGYWCCGSVFPESPRWLLATQQIPAAKKSLQDFSSRNGSSLQDEMFPGQTALTDIDSVFGEDSQPSYHTVLELRRTRVIWKNCLILSFTLFIGTGIQYCFTRNVHSYNTNFYFTYFIRVLTGALACVFICLSVNHFGRRGMLLLSAIVTGLSSLLLLALTP
ncbi:hypothetical protein WMY93_013451, partial [Mugilogobius chulae]